MLKKLIKKIKNSYIVKNYMDIIPYVRPYKVRALLAIFVTLPIGMMDTAIPWALKNYIDSLSSGVNNFKFAAFMPVLIIVFSFLQSAFTYLATYLNAWVGVKISNGLKYDLFKKLMRFEADFFDKNVSGTIQARFNLDVDAACAGLLNNLKMFSMRIFNSLSLIVALFVISWRLAIVAIIVLLVALYPLTTIRKRIQDIVNATVGSGAAIATYYIETFAGNRVIMSYNLYSYQLKRFIEALTYAFKLSIKMTQRSGMLSPIMHLVIGVGIAVIIWCGSYLISHNHLTVGGFTAFITSVIMLYQPIKSLGNDVNAVQMSVMAIERVFKLLREIPKIINKPNAITIDAVKKGIEYKDVTFEYTKDKPVLKRVNLKINVGETVAFVGNSGGGKTTMVSLLSRFYDVTSGKIMVDGKDIRNIDLDSLRNKIAIVFQDNFLFQGSIKDNILLGNENATKEEINQAVKSACLDEFISSLDKGLDTQIGERGVLLSGGQKQRVAIARAFIKNAPIVVLDEATSALDNKSEAVVQRAIDNLMKDRTVLVIAHRLSTVRNADKIVVVNYGEIAEIGTHNELINKKDGIYAALYNAQLSPK